MECPFTSDNLSAMINIEIIEYTGELFMKSNTPTMKDVAREAGVALGTVSKVFNGSPLEPAIGKK